MGFFFLDNYMHMNGFTQSFVSLVLSGLFSSLKKKKKKHNFSNCPSIFQKSTLNHPPLSFSFSCCLDAFILVMVGNSPIFYRS